MGKKTNSRATHRKVDDSKAASSEAPPADQRKSPLLSAVKLGSGRLIPHAANPTGPVVGMFADESEVGVLMIGTFMTFDVAVPPEQGLKNALEAFANSLCFATRKIEGPASAGEIRGIADVVLAQLLGQIQTARSLIDGMSSDAASISSRVQAHELLDLMNSWVSQSMLFRSGRDAAAPLEVPQTVADWSIELGKLGRRLRHYMREAARAGESSALRRTPKDPDPPDPQDSDPLTRPERKLLEVLADVSPGDGRTGKQILTAFCERGLHGVGQSTLTTRLVPRLRAREWEIPNRRGVGYHLSKTDRELFAKIDTRPRD